MKRTLALILLSVIAICGLCPADDASSDSQAYLTARPELIDNFRKARFGLFIHWGPVSIKGTEIGWSRGCDRFDRPPMAFESTEEYDNAYKKFNPVKFDADQWVTLAKEVGMQYMVFTAKHMGGFCMYDTQKHDYKITSDQSPYGKDIVKQLADACRRHGLGFAPYYCNADWWYVDKFDDYLTSYDQYQYDQVKELCTNYGELFAVWFDSGPYKPPFDAHRLFKLIRTLQPNALINNRTLILDGDYDTPEQKIGRFQTDRPWETCMTLGDHWAWHENDRIKTLEQCIYVLVHTMGGDGNLLLNVGPMPDGRIEDRQIKRLREIGAWLKKYGHTVLDTRGGPYKSNPWLASTHCGNTIYVHLTREDTSRPVVLNPIPHKINRALVVTGGSVRFEQTSEKVVLHVDSKPGQSLDTIVQLDLNAPAADIEPMDVILGPHEFVSAKSSSIREDDPSWGPGSIYGTYPPERAIDDNFFTIWQALESDKTPWFEADLGEVRTVSRLLLKEVWHTIDKFSVQCRAAEDESWKPLFTDGKMGDDYQRAFEPVQMRYLRIEVLESSGIVGLRQIHPFTPAM